MARQGCRSSAVSRMLSASTTPADRQAGLLFVAELPDDSWKDRWERIICPPGLKERLLNTMLFCLGPRASISLVGLPTHGLIVLAGPPGTGKTTLAYGLADQVARVLLARGLADSLRFAQVDAHVLPSELLGQSQRGVARLFDRIIPDLVGEGTPVVVLLDEVEGLAVSRRRTSMETNPADVHRATEAALSGLDEIARAYPNVVFVATTNYVEAVDDAFLSRADVIEILGLPPAGAIEEILRDTLYEVPGGPGLRGDLLRVVAERCACLALDARQVRKLVLRALVSSDAELALGERPICIDDLTRAIECEPLWHSKGGVPNV